MKSYKKKIVENRNDKIIKNIDEYSKQYMNFLNNAKTERMAVKEIILKAKEDGYVSLEEVIKKGSLVKGDKIYFNQKNKACILAVVGEDKIIDGTRIVGSHIDSPRLDLKANPVFEKDGITMLRTHYYGGVKKYHWVGIPLSLIGVLYNKKGEEIDVCIGESEEDPVFYITDLLIHLSKDELQKKASEVIEGEMLTPLAGLYSLEETEKKSVKANVMRILKEKYNIEDEDFVSAELEIVPSQKAREVGFDRSMIMAHGHDDRVCSYANLEAILNADSNGKTKIALFADKEEIGSIGNTGITSNYWIHFIGELLNLQENYNELKLRRAIHNSEMLSADVNTALDPKYASAVEKDNVAELGYGIVISKYTGARGKSGTNDANPEFIAKVKNAFNKDGVNWQTGELGKIDQGGGGTISSMIAEWGCEVLDAGVGMLSMHSPLELIAKADAYNAYKAYLTFFKM